MEIIEIIGINVIDDDLETGNVMMPHLGISLAESEDTFYEYGS